MSCDPELANEKTRCSGRNASYITMQAISNRTHYLLEIIIAQFVKENSPRFSAGIYPYGAAAIACLRAEPLTKRGRIDRPSMDSGAFPPANSTIVGAMSILTIGL